MKCCVTNLFLASALGADLEHIFRANEVEQARRSDVWIMCSGQRTEDGCQHNGAIFLFHCSRSANKLGIGNDRDRSLMRVLHQRVVLQGKARDKAQEPCNSDDRYCDQGDAAQREIACFVFYDQIHKIVVPEEGHQSPIR